MALPETQTATTICTQALSNANFKSPSAAQIAAAQTGPLRDALEGIFQGRAWNILEEKHRFLLEDHVSEFSPPSDFLKVLEVRLYQGEFFGTLQAGTTSSLTLAADEDIEQDHAEGKAIVITSGDASGQMSRITSYDTATKVAAVSPSFATAPGTGGYLIVENDRKLDPMLREESSALPMISPPTHYYLYDDPELFFLNGHVDHDDFQYVIELKYLLDIVKVDLTDARLSRVYTKYRRLIIQGVVAQLLRNKDDSRYETERDEFTMQIYVAKTRDAQQRTTRDGARLRSRGGLPN